MGELRLRDRDRDARVHYAHARHRRHVHAREEGAGFWIDDGSLSGTAELLRFTGTIRAVVTYDAKSFTFQSISRTITRVTSPICEMLETGLKTRH